MNLFDRILVARGVDKNAKASFLNPDYNLTHDPYLLPDMNAAVERLVLAHKNQEKITIYGDYDIDGLSSSALLKDAFERFGFENVEIYIPNRFEEGFGLASSAIEKIAETGVKLIVTVDCGSQSIQETLEATKLGIDMIITDHHEPPEKLPPAVAVVNPKRTDSKYPFVDLAGVGVAFKLVQAMQKKLTGISKGQEKWLLDLVALGTVCDVVSLTGENRILVHFGLKVLAKTRRPGLKALIAVARIEPTQLNARALGFGLGPRMNAAGRLETAQHALDMLLERDSLAALKKAEVLDDFNLTRRTEQDRIFKQACEEAEKHLSDSVLVLTSPDWNHGIVGIVATKIMEKYRKPVFLLQEISKLAKGSARSYGDFSIVESIKYAGNLISKGGGHKFAGGVTMPLKNIKDFREEVNKSYAIQGLILDEQQKLLTSIEDVTASFDEITEELIELINELEPFGIGNPQPVLRTNHLIVKNIRQMGDQGQHIKLELQEKNGLAISFVAFNTTLDKGINVGDIVSVWYHLRLNEWQGRRAIEGNLLRIEKTES